MSKRVIRVYLSKNISRRKTPNPYTSYEAYALDKIFAGYEVRIDEKAPDLLLYHLMDKDKYHLEVAYGEATQVMFSGENLYGYVLPCTESWVVSQLLHYGNRYSLIRGLCLGLARWLVLHYAPEKWWYRHFVLIKTGFSRYLYRRLYTRIHRAGNSEAGGVGHAAMHGTSWWYRRLILFRLRISQHFYRSLQTHVRESGHSNVMDGILAAIDRMSGWQKGRVLIQTLLSRHAYKPVPTSTHHAHYSVLSNAAFSTTHSVSLPLLGIAYRKAIEKDSRATRSLPIQRQKFCCIIVSNIYSIPRLHFFMKLSHYKQVDFYGHPAFRNTDRTVPHGWGGIMRSGIYREYKFVICFENSSAAHYLTEKFLLALYADSVPIYWGDPCVGEYFNSERMIAYSDYKSFDKMIAKVIELDQDHEKYRAFVAQPKQTPANIRKVEAMWTSYHAFMARILEEAISRRKERQ